LDGLWDRVSNLQESICDISAEMEYVSDGMRQKIEKLKEVKNDN
jgi:hypothetical protein